MDIIKNKIKQAATILNELGIDCWLTFVRETEMVADPVMPMVVGFNVTWESFFIYTRRGDAIAVVGNFDEENFVRSGRFTEVITYTQGVSDDFRRLITRLNPGKIAVNYSTNNVAADGLTHGMYLMLQNYLKDTPFADRLISAETLISKLRSRKLPEEISLLRTAAEMADEVWHELAGKISVGMTEKQVAESIDRAIADRGCSVSFPTIVNAGDKTRPGHSLPTSAIITPGDLLHVDFGVRYQGYCSDIQRLLYFRRPAEKEPPQTVLEAFDTVNQIITDTAAMCRPGVQGHEVDTRAREMLTDNGYPEYEHALGHQLGRDVHDGGAIIGPRWERYGVTPTMALEQNNAFTLELEIILPGIGCVGLEEDMYITENGAEFLSPRQTELIIK